MALTRLTGAEWVPTAHTSGTIIPTLIVVHDTGSRITKGNVVNYLKRNKRKVSYHIVIERDGSVVQMAGLDRRCHHAGRSTWQGRKWCNSYSIGIGVVNPGMMQGTEEKAKAWYGKAFTSDDGLTKATSTYHGNGGVWLNYTPAQIESLTRVIAEIKEAYPDIDVAGHYQVSPGRKFDPAPAPVIDLPAIEIGGLGNVGESLDAAIGCGDGLVAHEVMHATDTAIVVPSTDKVLRKQSREYKTAGFIRGAAATPVVGAGIMEAASLSNVQGVKSYLDVIKSTIADHGATFLIIGCVVAMIAASAIQHWKRQSYEDGRYEPSGEAES